MVRDNKVVDRDAQTAGAVAGEEKGAGSATDGTEGRGVDLTMHGKMEAEHLKILIAKARNNLADLEVQITRTKSSMNHVRASMFKLVRDFYQQRDQLRLVIKYRRKFLDKLLGKGDDSAAEVMEAYQEAKEGADQDYKSSDTNAANSDMLSDPEKAQINTIWRKLVRLFHPDRVGTDLEKQSTYQQLTSVINKARDDGDIKLLQEIADGPEIFIDKRGWEQIDLNDQTGTEEFRKLFAGLQNEIIACLEQLIELADSPDFELWVLSSKDPELMRRVAELQKQSLMQDIVHLDQEASNLKNQIDELGGEENLVID